MCLYFVYNVWMFNSFQVLLDSNSQQCTKNRTKYEINKEFSVTSRKDRKTTAQVRSTLVYSVQKADIFTWVLFGWNTKYLFQPHMHTLLVAQISSCYRLWYVWTRWKGKVMMSEISKSKKGQLGGTMSLYKSSTQKNFYSLLTPSELWLSCQKT